MSVELNKQYRLRKVYKKQQGEQACGLPQNSICRAGARWEACDHNLELLTTSRLLPQCQTPCCGSVVAGVGQRTCEMEN